MKINLFLSFALVVLFLGFSGCTTTESTKKSPPPATSSAQETPTPPPATGTGDASTAPAVQPPVDDGSIMPLDKLPKGKGGYPYGIKTKWTGLVKSPYAQDKTLVDVGTMSSGTPVRCPHTGKIFIVP